VEISKLTKTYKTMKRLTEIAGVLMRFGFTDLVDRMGLGALLPASKRLVGMEELSSKEKTAFRLRRVLEELGPSFVKFGQMLSSRPDILGPEFTEELRKLQENVAPLPYETIREALAKGIESPLTEFFASIDEQPLAAGSLAQVHRAKLKNGQKVVVKVRRPGAVELFENDLEVLRFVAGLLEKHIEEAKVFRPTGMVEEFASAIARELDFLHEATVIGNFHKHIDEMDDVVIPEVIWAGTSHSVLTMTEVGGESLAKMLASGRKPSGDVLKKIIRLFLKQYFEMGLFHADPHPGNIRVYVDCDKIGLIDFGSVGMLTGRSLTDISLLYVAVIDNEPELAVAVLEEVLTDSTEPIPESVERELRWLLEYYRGLPAGEVEVERMFSQIVEVARKHHLPLPVEWVMLARSMTMLFSLIREINPNLNVLEEVKPYTGKVAKHIFSPKRAGHAVEVSSYRLMRVIADLPRVGRFALRRLLSGKYTLDLRHEGIDGLVRELESASNRLSFSVVIAAVIMGSSILMSAGVGPTWNVLDVIGLGKVSILALLGFVTAGFMGLGLAWAIYRSGKL
jgi:ubiquinone biosynthesis protein